MTAPFSSRTEPTFVESQGYKKNLEEAKAKMTSPSSDFKKEYVRPNMEKTLAGRYQVVQNLARGGFGQTFLARDIYLPGHPFCVVKQLKPKVKNPAILITAKRLFDREAETLHKLGNHDQIPQLFANFEQSGNFYLVQEFIEGETLNKELATGKQLSEAYVIELLHDLLQVLSFVHGQNVIHRDIKPANLIRRNKDSKIVLIDFGAVKEVTTLAANSDGHTSLTVAVGSPGYMPPEQQAFKPHFSSDVYAVGMMGIQALTGLSPSQIEPDFRSGEICCASFQEIVSINPALGEILDRMVYYDYRQRYRSAKEALEALEKLIALRSKARNVASTILPTSKQVETVPKSKFETQKIPSLNPKFIERCQQELALYVGPFAKFMIDELLSERPQINAKEMVEALAAEIPKEARQALENLIAQQLEVADNTPSRSEKKSKNIQNDLPSKHKTEKGSSLNPDFLERCRQKLALYVGPVATYMIEDLLSESPQINAKELVEALTAQILEPEKAKEFKKYLLSTWT